MKVKEHCHGKPTVGIVKHQNLNMIKELNSYHILGKLKDMNLAVWWGSKIGRSAISSKDS